MAIEIDGGCVFLGGTSWKYEVNKREATYLYLFSSATKPEIGDFIVDGILVPRVGYKIVEDENSRLRKHMREEDGRGHNPYGIGTPGSDYD